MATGCLFWNCVLLAVLLLKIGLAEEITTDPTPRPNCPPNEEYQTCERCNRTCANPAPSCTAPCSQGCYCVGDLVRSENGSCVPVDQCPMFFETATLPDVQPIFYTMICGPHQHYKECETCEKTCSNPAPACPTKCSRGCFCNDGYVKGPDGRCVVLADCPKAEITLGAVQDLSVEDCGSNEEYLSCGWCEPTCSEPNPHCPQRVCTRGCLCRPPLLRHHKGQCVEPKECLPQKCSDPSEEYACRFGCEDRCDRRTCIRARTCQLGCHCKTGLKRDVDGKCVTPHNCSSWKATSKDLLKGSGFFKGYPLKIVVVNNNQRREDV